MLIKADGTVSDPERELLGRFAEQLGLTDELDELEKSVEGVSL